MASAAAGATINSRRFQFFKSCSTMDQNVTEIAGHLPRRGEPLPQPFGGRACYRVKWRCMSLYLRGTVVLLSFVSAYGQQKALMLKSNEIPYQGRDVKTAWVWRAPDGSIADAFIHWPAGVFEGGKPETTSTHPFAVRIAVLDGTVLFQFEGGEAKELKAGAYIVAPANARHYLGCKAGGRECVMFAVFSPDPAPPK